MFVEWTVVGVLAVSGWSSWHIRGREERMDSNVVHYCLQVGANSKHPTTTSSTLINPTPNSTPRRRQSTYTLLAGSPLIRNRRPLLQAPISFLTRSE